MVVAYTKTDAYKDKAIIKAQIVPHPWISLAPKFGKDGLEYIVVTKEAGSAEWVYKGREGLHGNQFITTAFVTGFGGKFAKVKGKATVNGRSLPPAAAGLMLAKIKGLTVKPGRKKIYRYEETKRWYEELGYGEYVRRGEEAAETVKAELKIRV